MFEFIKSKINEFKEKLTGKKEEDIKLGKKVNVGIVKKITSVLSTTIKLDEKDIEEPLEELKLYLIQSDVNYEVAEELVNHIKKEIVGKELDKKAISNIVKNTFKAVLDKYMIEIENPFEHIEDKPYVVMFFGVNGTGKTTTISKLAYLLKQKGKQVVVAACDTFRAASIEQLEEHSKKIGFKLIKRNYNVDPTSVAFDAVQYARAKHADVVLIDTAGRQEVNVNLMKQLEKMYRVIKPNITIFVGESISGNALYNQLKSYNEIIPINYVILTKFDLDPKGGVILTSALLNIPILFLGVGEQYNDLILFKKEFIFKKLLGE